MRGATGFSFVDFSAFQSDSARVIAVVIVAIAAIVIGSIKPISKAWVEDRKDRRKYEQQNRRLQNKIKERERTTRERE
jgi:uncharacterized membrane protein (DUF106 family)